MSIAEDETDPLAGAGPIPMSNVADKRLASTLEDIRPLFSDADPPDQDSVEGKFSWVKVGTKGYLPALTRCEETGKAALYVSVKVN